MRLTPMKEREDMHKKRWMLLLVVAAVMLAGLAFLLTHADISALAQPGPLESLIAGGIRSQLIGRAARTVPEPAVENNPTNISKGEDLYDMDCASCHGEKGRNPTPLGKSLYPRAADLGSLDVQKMSGRERFWVIKNGIRLSGMPGFGRIDTDQEIWQLTYYIRTLRKSTKQ
jgi:mono/diheme cytochrome c family protein